MTDRPRRDPVEFGYDKWELVALEKTSPHPTAYDKWMYLLTHNRIMFVPQECAQKIGTLDPQPGEEFYVRKFKIWTGKKPRVEWDVTQDPAMLDPDTGLPESDLTRQLRESREIAKKVRTRTQVRDNLARQQEPEPPSWTEEAPHPADLVKRPPQMAPAAIAAPQSKPAQSAASSSTAAMTQLEAALHTVLAACKSATAYARQIEYQAPPFTSDDIARMAMTLVIGKEQRR